MGATCGSHSSQAKPPSSTLNGRWRRHAHAPPRPRRPTGDTCVTHLFINTRLLEVLLALAAERGRRLDELLLQGRIVNLALVACGITMWACLPWRGVERTPIGEVARGSRASRAGLAYLATPAEEKAAGR